MPKNRAFLFGIQFLGYLWYGSLFLIIIPWILVAAGKALDYLVFTYFLKIKVSGLGMAGLPLTVLTGILATLCVLFGTAIVLWAGWVLVKETASFPLNFISHKDLTPKKLAVNGPYAKVRHPMLLGYVFLLMGIAAYGQTLLGVVWLVPLLAALMLEYLFLTEERHLLAWFGEEYQKYRAATPSLIPKWK